MTGSLLKQQIIAHRRALPDKGAHTHYTETVLVLQRQGLDTSKQYVQMVIDAAGLPRYQFRPPSLCRRCGKRVKGGSAFCLPCFQETRKVRVCCDWCANYFMIGRGKLLARMKRYPKAGLTCNRKHKAYLSHWKRRNGKEKHDSERTKISMS